MNIYKTLSAAMAGVLVSALAASGQGRGFDTYGVPATLPILAPTLLSGATVVLTNAPVDTHIFVGTAKVDITSFTNAGGALTVLPITSTDNTNWTALLNYSVSTSISVKMTNLMYGATNMFTTNTYNSSYAITVPTAATAGFATAYQVPQPFTNSGALTITAKGIYTIGYNIDDAGRYFALVFTPTGSSSNDVVAAALTTYKNSQIQNYP